MHATARRLRLLVIVVAFLIAPPPPASAQVTRDARVAASLGGTFGDGGPALAVSASAAYPAVGRARLEVEGSFVRRLDFGNYYSCPPDAVCAAVVSFPFTLTGDAASLGGNIVAELPWSTQRIRPYVVGGAGIAHVRRERRERWYDGRTFFSTLSSTGPLITAGGGIEFLLGRRVTLAADARYQRMYEKDHFHRIDIRPNLDLVRIGSSVGYRF